MFNKEYQFNLNQIAELLQFPYGEGVICETHLDTDWVHEFGQLWEKLTGNLADNFEGNNVTHVHNPTTCYFSPIFDTHYFGLGEQE